MLARSERRTRHVSPVRLPVVTFIVETDDGTQPGQLPHGLANPQPKGQKDPKPQDEGRNDGVVSSRNWLPWLLKPKPAVRRPAGVVVCRNHPSSRPSHRIVPVCEVRR